MRWANDLAARMGYTPKAVSDILQGNCRITPEVAIALEIITEISANYWLRRQVSYDEFLSRQKLEESLKDQRLWEKSFPSEMTDRCWVGGNEKKPALSLLKFFAVASPKAWDSYYKDVRLKVAFRISLAEVLAHVLYHGKKGICLQNIGVSHNYPKKEDEANCFAQKCMTDAVF